MKETLSFVIGLFVSSVCIFAQNNKSKMLYQNNRLPLMEKPYMELPLGAIKPKGWLLNQLERQKSGLTGNLDAIYPEVMGKRNGWLGGDGDVWERGPYWIDGLLPLAYILNDQKLIEKTNPWIEWAIKSQEADGYFGPRTDHPNESGLQRTNSQDWWPKMVMLKVLQQYYSATSDQRVIKLMLDYFKYQLRNLPEKPLNYWTHWGKARGGDNLAIVYWLYNLTGEKFLLNLAELIHHQTDDWINICLKGELTKQWNLHCVDIAQGIKEPIVYFQQNPDKAYIEAVRKGLADLKLHHGLAHGLYGADEMLHSNNPTQGSELCTAVEMLFSMETILPVTGKVEFADQLERVAYNALPPQTTDLYDCRQYYQQANQVMITRYPRNFNTPYEGTEQLFGVLTGYPCCTANMHQGWPKFTQNLWYATADRGVAALIYAPSKVTARVSEGQEVEWTEKTNYPFDENIIFTLKTDSTVKFPFHLRIPGWCRRAIVKVNGMEWDEYSGNQIVAIRREWKNGDTVELILPMDLRNQRWHENSVSIERGPLVFALKIGENWERKVNNDRYGSFYYEVKPLTTWNYGLVSASLNDLSAYYQVVKKEIKPDLYPWNQQNCPIEIRTKGVKLPSWQLYNESTGPIPYSEQYQLRTDTVENITLIPYGCTTLRISQFPIVRVYQKNEKIDLSGLY